MPWMTKMSTSIRGRLCDVRPVTQVDKDAILAVYRECEDFLALGPQPKATMAMVLGDMGMSRKQGASFCGIHDAGGRMIGIVDFARGGFEGKPDIAYISLLMLASGRRGRGIGAEVVGLIEREIRKDPRVAMIRSAVQANNPGAQRFWLKHGSRIIGGPELQPDGTTVFHLQKNCR